MLQYLPIRDDFEVSREEGATFYISTVSRVLKCTFVTINTSG